MATNDYTAKSQNYQTPENIYNNILDFAGLQEFNCDTCCKAMNIPARIYYTPHGIYSTDRLMFENENGLNGSWVGKCWMNPPWRDVNKWLKKAFSEAKENDCEVWCCIPGDRMNVGYSDRLPGYQKFLNENKNWFGVFLAGKFNFYNPDATPEQNKKNEENGGLNSPVLILYIGKNHAEYEKRWRAEMPINGIVFS